MAEQTLNGRIALITGGSRGLGKSMALALSDAGAHIALVARDEQKLEAAAAEIRQRGGKADIFCADVSKEDDVSELEKAVAARLGKIQILINNAGVNVRKNITDFTLDDWNFSHRSQSDVGIPDVPRLVPHMKGTGYGRIVNLTSIMSHVSLPGRAAYSASKAGLLGLIRAVALELGSRDYRERHYPGPFATDMNQVLMQDPEINQQFLSRIPVGHWGKVEDIGALATFLCSDSA